ncbi:MAG: 16S rRNA (uracil(1498)-N(3))-methyltransferase [Puniceicoccales bacterium]|jgi:16S rRNA (uracil1498-N3)-methyltransferase|nr:16S rRNA (uracil(1498)-N(3))-methyltransferase [Puniceicoccales bacterium]
MTSIFRCFVPQASQFEIGQEYGLPNPEAHHLVHVLRASADSEIHLLDGNGHITRANLRIYQRKARVYIKEHLSMAAPTPRIILAQGFLKKNAMDLLFRDASALGVSQIAPIIAKHSELKIPPSQIASKMEHWRSIAIAACKQSGQAFLPQILIPQHLEIFFSKISSESNVLLVGKLARETPTLWQELESITLGQDIASMILFIGPEGDFNSEEYQLLAAKGARNIRLSRQILRAETASVYALSVIDQWRQYDAEKFHG